MHEFQQGDNLNLFFLIEIVYYIMQGIYLPFSTTNNFFNVSFRKVTLKNSTRIWLLLNQRG